jgi:hypothetical protein
MYAAAFGQQKKGSNSRKRAHGSQSEDLIKTFFGAPLSCRILILGLFALFCGYSVKFKLVRSAAIASITKQTPMESKEQI